MQHQYLKKFQSFLAVWLLISSLLISGCQPNTKENPPLFVGTWTALRPGAHWIVEMSPNGRFTAQLNLKGTDVPQTLTGTWKVRGDKMIWVYEQDLPQLKKGQPDVNLILDPGPSSFVLVELDNTRTLYVKQKSSQ